MKAQLAKVGEILGGVILALVLIPCGLVVVWERLGGQPILSPLLQWILRHL